MKDRDSMGSVLGVATAVALACSLLVTLAVTGLRPYQQAWESLERNRAILKASGLMGQTDKLTEREVVSRYVRFEELIVDLDAGAFSTDIDPADYDYREAIDRATRPSAESGKRPAGAPAARPRHLPVWVLREDSRIALLVLPVYGDGMWSTIHGFVGIGPDLRTMTGASFYEHGETPGIGDRIQDPGWLNQWRNVAVPGTGGEPSFAIGDGQAPIDAITGATVTVTAVEGAVAYWFGERGYGPFLTKLRNEAVRR